MPQTLDFMFFIFFLIREDFKFIYSNIELEAVETWKYNILPIELRERRNVEEQIRGKEI